MCPDGKKKKNNNNNVIITLEEMFSEAYFYPAEPEILTPLRLGVRAEQRRGNLSEKQTQTLPDTCYLLLFKGR